MPLSDINRLSAVEIASRIAAGSLSAVEAVEAALARCSEVEPQLNAFVHVDREGALRAAHAADVARAQGETLGPLHGVPISVKDLIDVAGLPAEYGSLTLKGNVAAADAPSVERLRAAGAIIIGKTTTSEFGYRGYTRSLAHGNTRNPVDLKRTPGGSSGGAVASVAAGVTPIALGTDGGGSIRSPAALTGLVGIKPTFARIPVWPASATPTLAHVGPIARSVADAALVLQVCTGADMRDPFSLMPPLGNVPSLQARNLRVAFSMTLGYARVDAPVAAVVAAAIHKLRAAFPTLEEVEYVCDEEGEILGAEFIGGCSARLGDAVDNKPELIDPPLLSAIQAFRTMSSDHFTRLQRRRLAHRERLRHFFERYDLLLTPTTPCVAWSIDSALPPGHETASVWSYFTYPFNLSGQPAVNLPCGLTPEGLPVGLQLVAGLGQEAAMLGAAALSEATLGPEMRPVLAI